MKVLFTREQKPVKLGKILVKENKNYEASDYEMIEEKQFI